MQKHNLTLMRYEADDGYVFDWKEPRYTDIYKDGIKVDTKQEHLYAKVLYIGAYDSIDNYIEVEAMDNEANENT